MRTRIFINRKPVWRTLLMPSPAGFGMCHTPSLCRQHPSTVSQWPGPVRLIMLAGRNPSYHLEPGALLASEIPRDMFATQSHHSCMPARRRHNFLVHNKRTQATLFGMGSSKGRSAAMQQDSRRSASMGVTCHRSIHAHLPVAQARVCAQTTCRVPSNLGVASTSQQESGSLSCAG